MTGTILPCYYHQVCKACADKTHIGLSLKHSLHKITYTDVEEFIVTLTTNGFCWFKHILFCYQPNRREIIIRLKRGVQGSWNQLICLQLLVNVQNMATTTSDVFYSPHCSIKQAYHPWISCRKESNRSSYLDPSRVMFVTKFLYEVKIFNGFGDEYKKKSFAETDFYIRMIRGRASASKQWA